MNRNQLRRITSFRDFKDPDIIQSTLLTLHQRRQEVREEANIAGTKRAYIGQYWTMAIAHLFIFVLIPLLILALSLSLLWPGQPIINALLLLVVIAGGVIFVFRYVNIYLNDFSPALQNAAENFAKLEERKAVSRSVQYTGFVLILIQYVYQALSGCSTLSLGRMQKDILCRQFGVSEKALENPLNDLLRIPFKDQTKAMQTKMRNYFGEAIRHFEALNNKDAITLLQQMQLALENGEPLPKSAKLPLS